MKFSKIRNLNYKQNNFSLKYEVGIDLNNWFKTPYSSIKTILFLETSAFLVFIIHFFNFSPNYISFIYIITSLIGGFLLSANDNMLVILGLIIFFFNGVFDWVDGFYARIKNKTSYLGKIIDLWGGVIYHYSFLSGFAFYLFNKSGNIFFLLLILLILFLKTIDIKIIFNQILIDTNVKTPSAKENLKNKISKFKPYNSSFFKTLSSLVVNLFDDRARSVDFICFFILLDLFFKEIFLLEYIFIFITFKHLLTFFLKIYFFLNK